MEGDLKVSVCVPTYGRPAQLRQAIEALMAADAPEGGFEVIVVDDGSPPDRGVDRVLDELAARFGPTLRWCRLDRNSGPTAARIRGASLAGGEWLAFTDDDCVPQPGWLIELLRAAEEEEADIVQGRTIPDPERAHLLGQPYVRSVRVEAANEYFQTCNIAYRHALFDEIGGFDPSFRFSAEDTDLGWRALAQGARYTFAPAAVVHHEVARTTFLGDLRGRRRWADLVFMIKKHPESARLAWRPFVYRPAHVPVLALAASVPLLGWRRLRPVPLVALAALLVRDALTAGSPEAAAAKVGSRVGDAWEVAILARESVRQRVLLL